MAPKKEKEHILIVVGTTILLAFLVIGSLGWFVDNWKEIYETLAKEEEVLIDVEPLPTPVPWDDESAVLIAECQDQLAAALIVSGPLPSDDEKDYHREYLDQAREARIEMMDLITVGRLMYDDLYQHMDSYKGKSTPAFREDWNRRSIEYREALVDTVSRVRHIGMSDAFVRISSELFLAYHYLDLFSDDINHFFVGENTVGVSDLRTAELHLDTVKDLLNR